MMLEAAMEYAEKGWRVFPLVPKGKVPMIQEWQYKATTNKQTISAWWTETPDANIGLATGPESDVYVIDLDGPDGEASWTEILTQIPDIAEETLESSTGKGRHLFFRYPDRKLGNRTNMRKGVDVRAEGGYVVLPPSIHPSGRQYDWPFGTATNIAIAPRKLNDMVARETVAQEKPEAKKLEPNSFEPVFHNRASDAILDRAVKYLAECEPAVQGQGGHNALLWAARAMVVGFDLSDAVAERLLWDCFNPRCNPPWTENQRRDFSRKVFEARNTASQKPVGWLLDEYGLRSGDDALLARGAAFAESLLRSRVKQNVLAAVPETVRIEEETKDFPLDVFPSAIREYIETVADVQLVSPASVALSVLVAAGSCLGNAFVLRLKKGYEVRPTLWGVIVARSGSNKSGPFREVIRPLRIPLQPQNMSGNLMLSPSGQLLIEDSTTESILDVLTRSPKGLCLANGELAGWVGSFDRYSSGGGKKKTSVDETIWLKFYDGDAYTKNRKTEGENITIHSASVSVVGCIQPEKMAECFDPAQFASGLVPRLLVVSCPKRRRGWSEREMNEDTQKIWTDCVMKLRGLSFATMDPATANYIPNVLGLSFTGKERFVEEIERLADAEYAATDAAALFLSKAKGLTGRLALIRHALSFACGESNIMAEVGQQSVEAAIKMQRYFVDAQLSVYGFAGKQFIEASRESTIAAVRKYAVNGLGKTRTLYRNMHITQQAAVRNIDELVKDGLVSWTGIDKLEYKLEKI